MDHLISANELSKRLLSFAMYCFECVEYVFVSEPQNFYHRKSKKETIKNFTKLKTLVWRMFLYGNNL